MEHAVETVNLSRLFRNHGSVIKALDNVNIQVREGEIFGLLGPNGAGKTTLVKILTTLLLPTEGKAYVLGYDVESEAGKIRPLINLVSGGDTPGYGLITVRENLWFYSMLYGLDGATARKRIQHLIEEVGLVEVADELLRNLSTGYRQRLNLARGLVNDPKVLFLDEPTIGLDAVSARKVRRMIKDWVRGDSGRTVILTSHYMAEVEELCDRVAILNNGRLLALGTPEELKRSVIGKTVVIIDAKLPEGVEQVFQELEGYYETFDPASGIHRIRVVLDDWSETAYFVEKIATMGGKVLSVTRAVPSFEDVYIKLVGGGESG
ncbi:MAG: ABC transporter ATP-binding protein [Candidatus Caldarchaeum sp.]